MQAKHPDVYPADLGFDLAATRSASASQASPIDLASAVRYAAQGQTVELAGGTYETPIAGFTLGLLLLAWAVWMAGSVGLAAYGTATIVVAAVLLALAGLASRSLVHDRSAYDPGLFTFHHQLIRDVAYDSLPR